jgi:hypothetical protein
MITYVILENHGVDKADVPHDWPGIWNPAVAVVKKIEESGSVYEGPIDPMSGVPNGHGKMVYKDGGYYEGCFFGGMRHGPGQLKQRDGSTYIGLFENDLMHGEGKLIQTDGTAIQTTWVYGRKHGKGMVISPDNTKHYSCVYYHDMENLLDRTATRCYDCSWLNIVFSLIIIGSLFPALYVHNGVFAVTGISYLFLLIETCCSQTYTFLSNVMSVDQVERYLTNLSDQSPQIKFWIQNYHYETRHYTDSKGNSHTKKVRVNTHHATEFYIWGDCVDKSPEPSCVDIIKQFKLTRLENKIDVTYSPEAFASLHNQEATFKHNHIRDVHWDFSILTTLNGYNGEILLHNGVEQPWYASKRYYVIFSMLLMGWLYRILFIWNSQKVSFSFNKTILK